MMRRLVLWLVLAVIAAGAGVLAIGTSLPSGCTERDEALATKLDKLPVLDVRPDRATVSDRYSGCDSDDGFAFAGRKYQPADLAVTDAVILYRSAFLAGGWALESENASPVPKGGLVISGAHLCFSAPLEGVRAHLSLWFPSDFGDKHHDYGVEVTASHDGDAWC